MTRLVFILFIFFYFSSDILACRIWAVISKSNLSLNMTSQQELDFVSSQLDALFDQSQYNQNGWAVIRYGIENDSIDDTVFRSELPANQDSLNYWTTMNAIFNQQSDNIAIAHIRAATSGASAIPNPHPWIFESGKTYSFVHNGGASKELLYDLINIKCFFQAFFSISQFSYESFVCCLNLRLTFTYFYFGMCNRLH